MMGRRRRKVVRIPKKRLPKVFLCPKCGREAIRVITVKDSNLATVTCGACGLKDTVQTVPAWAPVDIYSTWADRYYKSENT